MAMSAVTVPQLKNIPPPPALTGEDPLKVMVGGAKFQQQFLDWTKQSNHLYLTVLFAILFMWAIYSEKLPMQYRWQLNTTLGRMLLMLLLYIVYLLGGWIPALLFAIAIALTWANRPLFKPVPPSAKVLGGTSACAYNKHTAVSVKENEGFDNIKVTDVSPHMWFVEKALKENPQRIIQDRVQTFAVQEDNTSGTSRTSR